MMIKRLIMCMLLLLVIVSCTDSQSDGRMHFKNSLTCRQYAQPCVTFMIGETKATFILDTGSNMSIIDKGFYERHSEHFTVVDSVSMGVKSLGGTTRTVTKVCQCSLNDTIKASLFVLDIEDTVEYLFKNNGVLINGLLGTDFMYRYKVIIDFDDRSIYNFITDTVKCSNSL